MKSILTQQSSKLISFVSAHYSDVCKLSDNSAVGIRTMDKTPPKPPPSAQKRNRQDDANMTLNVEIVKEDGGFVAKKPRDSDSEAIDAIAEAQDVIDAAVEDDTIQSNDFDDDYDDEEDDDYDDLVFFINYCSHFKLV